MSELYTVVNSGVDSLWLNVTYGTGDDLETMVADRRPLDDTALLEQLAAYQVAARQTMKPAPTSYQFADACLVMYGNGGGLNSPWRFILRNHALELKIGLGKRNGVIAKVRLSAEYLWSERDLMYCLYAVHAFLIEFFQAPVFLQVSRVDLCTDITGYDFGTGNWQDGFIRRCGVQPHFSTVVIDGDGDSDEDIGEHDQDVLGVQQAGQDGLVVGPDSIHMRYRPITGFTFGSRKSAMSAIVYNKSNYIKYKKPETVWFDDLWRANGCEDTSAVWRIEFHLCREALHSMSLESAYELPLRLNALWEYCTINWLRYVVPVLDTNRSRWEAHEVWQVVLGAFRETLTYEQVELGPVVRERKREVNKLRMVAQITGCLITLHAWDKDKEVCEGDDLSLVLHRFYENAEDYLERKGREFNTEVRFKQRMYSLVA